MIIEGVKGCFEKTGGMFYFARMCSKIRLFAAGRLPQDYYDMLGKGFDGRTCRYLRVSYEDLKARVLAGQSDEDVLKWCLSTGGPLTDEQILIYNSFMSKRGWRDDETDGFIPAMIKEYASQGRRQRPHGLRPDRNGRRPMVSGDVAGRLALNSMHTRPPALNRHPAQAAWRAYCTAGMLLIIAAFQLQGADRIPGGDSGRCGQVGR